MKEIFDFDILILLYSGLFYVFYSRVWKSIRYYSSTPVILLEKVEEDGMNYSLETFTRIKRFIACNMILMKVSNERNWLVNFSFRFQKNLIGLQSYEDLTCS